MVLKKTWIYGIIGLILISSASAAFQDFYRENQAMDFVNEDPSNFEPNITVKNTWQEDGLIHIEYENGFYEFKNGNTIKEILVNQYPQSPPLYVSAGEGVNRAIFNDYVANETVRLREQISILQKHVKRKTQSETEAPQDYNDWTQRWADFWAAQGGLEI